jgi:hypothetical protein
LKKKSLKVKKLRKLRLSRETLRELASPDATNVKAAFCVTMETVPVCNPCPMED